MLGIRQLFTRLPPLSIVIRVGPRSYRCFVPIIAQRCPSEIHRPRRVTVTGSAKIAYCFRLTERRIVPPLNLREQSVRFDTGINYSTLPPSPLPRPPPSPSTLSRSIYTLLSVHSLLSRSFNHANFTRVDVPP